MAVPCEMLLHPELLSNEQLIHVMRERHMCIPNIECLPRDELLDLFHHYCVPYGQRKYRDSGRGKILNKTRHMSPERVTTKLNVFSNNCVLNNVQYRKSQNNCERLKPPPDILSGHMKRIKLENINVVLSKDVNINKRKMSIDAVPETDSPPMKKERKPITWP